MDKGFMMLSEFIRERMEAKGWNQQDLSFVIDKTASAINPILNGSRSVSLEMAQLLGVALDIDPTEIIVMQAKYDVAQLRPASEMVRTRARLAADFPLREMEKRGWINLKFSKISLEDQLKKFFKVTDLETIPKLAHAARKTTEHSALTNKQLVWLYRVKSIAAEQLTPSYQKTRLAEVVDELKVFRSDPMMIRKIPALLKKAGVRFVIVEALPGSKIDGVCFWLEKSPVIGLSMRFDRIDNFWFVLAHELKHVLEGHGKTEAILDEDLGREKNESIEEKIANEFAADFCVDSETMKSFYLRKKPYFSEMDLLAFSKRNKIHPGLVVGQLHKLTGRFEVFRKHLVKIRKNITAATMVDGWGDVYPIYGDYN